jgi:hypothetical protein
LLVEIGQRKQREQRKQRGQERKILMKEEGVKK